MRQSQEPQSKIPAGQVSRPPREFLNGGMLETGGPMNTTGEQSEEERQRARRRRILNREGVRAAQRRYRQRNKERLRAKDKERKARNKDKIKVQKRRQLVNNRDRINAMRRKRYWRNRPRMRAKARDRYQRNRETRLAKQREYAGVNRDRIVTRMREYNKRPEVRLRNKKWCRRRRERLSGKADAQNEQGEARRIHILPTVRKNFLARLLLSGLEREEVIQIYRQRYPDQRERAVYIMILNLYKENEALMAQRERLSDRERLEADTNRLLGENYLTRESLFKIMEGMGYSERRLNAALRRMHVNMGRADERFYGMRLADIDRVINELVSADRISGKQAEIARARLIQRELMSSIAAREGVTREAVRQRYEIAAEEILLALAEIGKARETPKPL